MFDEPQPLTTPDYLVGGTVAAIVLAFIFWLVSASISSGRLLSVGIVLFGFALIQIGALAYYTYNNRLNGSQ